MLKSRLLSGIGLILVVILICTTYSLRSEWWQFIDILFLFLGVFMHFMALAQPKALYKAAHKLEQVAGISILIGVIAFLVELVIYLL